ncbi:type II secretion system protein GspL [Thiomicrorhabdus indica]|uniref:type II secretion system protein GspL n=1 Tax=Thiomicrorhabdus indica TaxID=2267253 RepID=UPI00102DDD6B|nr:type II secretion system protein GspL [Thiomicrorhabdus indica]
MTEQPQISNVNDRQILPIKSLMLDAQANLLDADSQRILVSANDWQLNPESVHQILMDNGVSPSQIRQIQAMWVPTELVVLTQVDVPGKRVSDCQKALPFALEASLALPIEDYFIATFAKQKIATFEGQTPAVRFDVALVSHEQMRLWQQALKALGCSKALLLADCFRLQFSGEPQKGVFSQPVELEHDKNITRLFVRATEFSGFACPLDWGASLWQISVSKMLAKHSETGKEPSEIEDTESESLAGSIRFEDMAVVSDSEWLTSDLDSLPAGEKLKLRAVNLLQGVYATHQQSSGVLKVSLISVMLIGFWLILLLVETVQQTQQLNEKTMVYQQKSEELFKQMFPDAKRVVNIKSQTMSRLKSQVKAEQTVSLMKWLSAVEELLAMTPNVQVARVEWNASRNQLMLDLKAANSQQISRLSTIAKQRFAQFPISIVTKSVQPNLVEAQLYVR